MKAIISNERKKLWGGHRKRRHRLLRHIDDTVAPGTNGVRLVPIPPRF
ncbi:MAG: hypothetical protein IE886_00275 [Campylobacterales bacterium]|nr:hypothetical protein [Campylobacterales bacterium]